MKLFFLLLLFSLNSVSVKAGTSCRSIFAEPWFESTGIREKKLFSTSAITEEPIEMTVTIVDWENVHLNPARENANSSATFKLADTTLLGSVQARGQSRFNLFYTRALTFLIAGENVKLVNRNGGFKSQPKLSSLDQDARVLVEYLIYKIHEIIFKEDSVKTRLNLITYVGSNNKVIDKGYGFFLEGKSQLSKRLNYSEATTWDFPHDSAQAISGNIFRALILDGDQGNMLNNFIYLADKTDAKILKRVAYDFDYSALAPPEAIKLEDISRLIATYREWLEKSYKIGSTGDHQYPPQPSGTKAEQAKALQHYRSEIILSAKKIAAEMNPILTQIPWKLLPGTYQTVMKSWFKAALTETENFIKAHESQAKTPS